MICTLSRLNICIPILNPIFYNSKRRSAILVIQVIGNTAIGGAERHVFDLVLGLSQFGIEVEVICPQPGPLTEQFVRHGIPVHYMDMVHPWPHDEYILDLQVLQELIAFFVAKKPDVVHSHLYPAHLHASLAAHQVGVPLIVYTAHTLIARPGEGILSSATNCHLITVSQHVAFLLKQVGVPSDRIETIYNGVGNEHFEDAQKAQQIIHTELNLGRGPTIGVVSRLSPEKGIDVLIRAAAYLVQMHPRLTVLIIGDGPLAVELRQLTCELGLENNVQFLGTRTDIPSLNRQLDVFVLPSHEDGCSIALLEAMASERAVVATRVGGAPEIVGHEIDGYLVPPNNPIALSQTIHSLLINPDHRIALGKAARQKVSLLFTRDRMIRKTIEFYRKNSNKRYMYE